MPGHRERSGRVGPGVKPQSCPGCFLFPPPWQLRVGFVPPISRAVAPILTAPCPGHGSPHPMPPQLSLDSLTHWTQVPGHSLQSPRCPAPPPVTAQSSVRVSFLTPRPARQLFVAHVLKKNIFLIGFREEGRGREG